MSPPLSSSRRARRFILASFRDTSWDWPPAARKICCAKLLRSRGHISSREDRRSRDDVQNDLYERDSRKLPSALPSPFILEVEDLPNDESNGNRAPQPRHEKRNTKQSHCERC